MQRAYAEGGIAQPVEQRDRVRQRLGNSGRSGGHRAAGDTAVQRLRVCQRRQLRLCAAGGARGGHWRFLADGGGRGDRTDGDADADAARVWVQLYVQLCAGGGLRNAEQRRAADGEQQRGARGVSVDGAGVAGRGAAGDDARHRDGDGEGVQRRYAGGKSERGVHGVCAGDHAAHGGADHGGGKRRYGSGELGPVCAGHQPDTVCGDGGGTGRRVRAVGAVPLCGAGTDRHDRDDGGHRYQRDAAAHGHGDGQPGTVSDRDRRGGDGGDLLSAGHHGVYGGAVRRGRHREGRRGVSEGKVRGTVRRCAGAQYGGPAGALPARGRRVERLCDIAAGGRAAAGRRAGQRDLL